MTTVAIQKKIQTWKDNLAQLTKRNRLLNFHQEKLATVEILTPASQVFASLVKESPKLPMRELETQQTGEMLLKFLKKLREDANSVQREKGVNSLFVALGTLTWSFKDKPQELIVSPILLIPVELHKVPKREEYELRPTDEEISLNPALEQKLYADYGITLYESAAEQSISYDKLLDSVRRNQDIKGHLDWEVEDSAYIGLFQKPKAAMAKDLEQEELIASHPVLRGLANELAAYELNPPSIVTPAELDMLDPKSVFQTLEADSSQQVVIEAAKKKRNIIVQGPPGTGKSQTITNIITELIGDKQTVLIIAEKPVALEVVAKNLKKSGLEDVCLDLHHRSGVSKKNFAKFLQQTATQLARRDEVQELDSFFDKLDDCRRTLNNHVAAIHNKWQPIGKSAFDLYGEILNLQQQQVPTLEFDLRDVSSWSEIKLGEAKKWINKLRLLEQVFRQEKTTLWSKSRLRPPALNSEIRSGLRQGIVNLRQGITVGNNCFVQFEELFESETASTLTDLEALHSAAAHVADVPEVPEGWPQNTDIPALQQILSDLKKDIEDIQDSRDVLEHKYTPNFLTLDLPKLAADFREYKNIFRVFRSDYWRNHRKIIAVRKEKRWFLWLFAHQELRIDVEQAAKHKNSLEAINNPAYAAHSAFGQLFKAEASDLSAMECSLQWLKELQQYNLPQRTVAAVVSSPARRGDLGKLRDSLEAARNSVQEGFDFLKSYFPIPEEVVTASGVPLRKTPFDEISNFLDVAEDELDLFQQWLDCQNYVEQLKTMGAIAFLENLQASQIPQESWSLVFEKGFYENWLKYIYDSNPELRTFNSENHEKEIQNFSQLDSQQQEVARKRLRKLHADSWQEWSEQLDSREQTSLLNAESKKQKKHKEIREFIKEAAELVSILKPCWLMSPLAVSQYIPLQTICFDVVIFDEASQIRTEDAVPAIMRAKQVIVVGDSQQLPPTAFFAGITSDEEEEDDDEDAYESLLDECGKFMKSFTLQWHYRSQDESLIAFSNEKFYDSQLISFPNPVRDPNRGVHFHYVEGATYERGGNKRINIREAQEVAQLALEHIHNPGEQSLGIIAFSKDQADAIRKQIEQLSANNPELQELCQEDSDSFFLKNLENVQGDERDVVIISFGYGKDKRGTFTQNFGPLNKSGGDRRLNVAITRARYKLVLVASIHSEELKPEGKSRAVGLFKEYIEYASRITQEANENSNGSESRFNSPVLKDIYQALEDRGYVVKNSVGRSDYPIELAVVNDQQPEEFLLGLECDGEIYRKYSTARDRDRLRQLVLEKLGWKIHKIWSKDWFGNKSNQLERLIARLERRT